MRNVPSLETIYRDYSPKGVQFMYVYKALAHPELDGYVKPLTLEERLMHITEAKRTLGSQITWICDAMDNRLKHAIGDAPNSEYLLDPDGKIASMRAWSSPADLRKDLEGLVGPVENPTRVADLGMKTAEPPKAAPTGVVERVKMPGQMRALKVEPQLDKTKHPYYVKLRAEVGREALRDGKGKMYLGFHLDPLYGVHWNNQVAPVEYELFPPDGVTISPAKGNGPKVEVEADADPREFLLDVEFGEGSQSVPLKFRYFACTDKMCIPVTQAYTVHFEADRDGGAARRGPRGGPPRNPGAMVARMMERDADGDGMISKQEAPEQMQRNFDRMDSDGDGLLTKQEIEARMGQARGGRGPAPGRLMEGDANGDGKLTPEEIPERIRQRFDRMDANGDGFLTTDEIERMTRGRGRQ